MTAIIRRDAPVSLDVASLHKHIDGISDYAIKIHRAAQWYVRNGIMIVPFIDYGGGRLGYPKGISQHHATLSIDKIDEWWHPELGKYPGATIAMAHGGKSGYCALDLDTKTTATADGEVIKVDGISTLSDLILAYAEYDDDGSELLNTLMCTTPSGGRHLVFRYHPEIISNSEMSYPGIDTRGGLKRNPAENGGITFIEPSVKPGSGNKDCYRWDDKGTTDIIDMPQWLVDTLNGRPPQRRGIQLQDSYIQSAPGKHGDGRDRNIYMDLMRFVGAGYTEDELWDLMPVILERMDPPDEQMVRRKIESAIASDAFVKVKRESERREKSDSLDLSRTGKGEVHRTASNLDTIIRSAIFEHEFGLIEYDEFYHHFVKDKKPLAMVADYAMDIVIWISQNIKVEFGVDVVRKTVELVAYKRPHANAAREYMAACPRNHSGESDFWGSGRSGPGPAFKRLCEEVLDFTNPDLHDGYDDHIRKVYEAQLWFWLQGVCARACIPGCKMEMVLNIFGSQGIGKSTFFSSLLPNPSWFTDSIKDAVVDSSDNKDELKKLHGAVIAEMPELSPIKNKGKSSDDRFKQFISTQVDKFRAPFGKDTIDYPRTCALAGTSNNRDVYRDLTGDRRFLSIDHGSVPIKLGDIDNGVMAQIRDDLWGEVYSSFRPGELDAGKDFSSLHVCVPPLLRKHQSTINNSHRYEEIGILEILDWAKKRTRFTYAEIIDHANSVPGLRDAKEVAVIRMVRSALASADGFSFRKRGSRKLANGGTEKTNYWVNTKHRAEQGMRAGVPSPDHWSHFPEVIEDQETEAEEEY